MEFWDRYKKIFLVIGFLLFVALIGYLIYATFFKPSVVTTPPEEVATTTPGGLPSAGEGTGQIVEPPGEEATLPSVTGEIKPSEIASGGLTSVKEINSSVTQSATLSPNGSDLQYYDKNTGQFYNIDKDGNLKKLSDKIFYDVQDVTWSPKKNEAILEYPDGSNIVYNFETEKQISLPKHWKDFDFSPDGNQIVMKSIGTSEDNRWLAIANDDGSKITPIEPLGNKDATVYPSWSPNRQSIAMFTEGTGFDTQEVYFVGLNNENFKSATIEGRNFQPLWSTKGDKLLYSVASSEDDYMPSLWIVDAEGNNIGANRKNINLETWANKCTFADNSTLYCAVPESLQKGAGLFTQLADNSKDNLVKVDLTTGQKKMVAIPENVYNMSNLIVSENGYYLYFTDKNSGGLNQIRLK